MLQSFMWNAFQKTGNIDAYLSLKEIEKATEMEYIQEDIKQSEGTKIE